MSDTRKIQKALAGAEDLLLGLGSEFQTRSGQLLEITKINASLIPYSGDTEDGTFVSIKAQIDKGTKQTGQVGAIITPGGTTAERPIAAYDGYLRFNTDLNQIEAYHETDADWHSVGWNVVVQAAQKLATARKIDGISFDGTADISLTPVFVDKTAADGAANLPAGLGSARPDTPEAGMFRFNTTEGVFEGYDGSQWGNVGGATGGAGNPAFYENDSTITADYTITTGKNAMTAGPIEIQDGVAVTVPNNSVWTVV